VLAFPVNQKNNEAFRGICFLIIREKNLKLNLVLVVILIIESKALYCKEGVALLLSSHPRFFLPESLALEIHQIKPTLIKCLFYLFFVQH